MAIAFRNAAIYAALVVASSSLTLFAADWYVGKYVLVATRVPKCVTKGAPVLEANCTGELSHPDFGSISYHTNSMGMRDLDYPDSVYADGKAGASKILVLGDSMTFGLGVPQGDDYSSVVERRHPDLILFNAGYFGYGIQEEEGALRYLLPRTRPDLVIVAALANDLIDLWLAHKRDVSATARVPVLRNLMRLGQQYIPQHVLLMARGVLSDEWNGIYQATLDAPIATRYREYLRVVHRMDSTLCSGDRPVPFIVLLIPQVEQVNGFLNRRKGLSATAPFDHIKEGLAGSRVVILDSTPAFAGVKDVSSLFFPRDRHLTVQGHQVVAGFLEQHVSTIKNLIGSRDSSRCDPS